MAIGPMATDPMATAHMAPSTIEERGLPSLDLERRRDTDMGVDHMGTGPMATGPMATGHMDSMAKNCV